MRKLKTALFGTGFMGKTHAEAVRRLGHVEIAAIAGSSDSRAADFARLIGVDFSTGDYKKVLADPTIDAVHILTPNAMHHPMAKDALLAGKAVVCEKPLTMTVAEAEELVALAKQTGLPNAVQHNLRYYPVVQHIRQLIKAGELGDILAVQGTYSQDWLLYDTDWNWRVDSSANGALRAMGDIGSHWMDMIQHLTGQPITAVCAELTTVHRTRKKPQGSVETFTGKTANPDAVTEFPIDTDDFGAVLIHLGDRARGCFTVSQISAGNKNSFRVEIYGTKGGVSWNQERPDELWLGHRNANNQMLLKDPSLLLGPAASYADYPGGHSEGYDDTHKQLLKRFYAKVADPTQPEEYPTFADGLHGMRLLEKVQESDKRRAWVDC